MDPGPIAKKKKTARFGHFHNSERMQRRVAVLVLLSLHLRVDAALGELWTSDVRAPAIQQTDPDDRPDTVSGDGDRLEEVQEAVFASLHCETGTGHDILLVWLRHYLPDHGGGRWTRSGAASERSHHFRRWCLCAGRPRNFAKSSLNPVSVELKLAIKFSASESRQDLPGI